MYNQNIYVCIASVLQVASDVLQVLHATIIKQCIDIKNKFTFGT